MDSDLAFHQNAVNQAKTDADMQFKRLFSELYHQTLSQQRLIETYKKRIDDLERELKKPVVEPTADESATA